MLRPSTAELRERDFDAKEALLIAQGMNASPTPLWSTTALLMTLSQVIKSQPYESDGTLVLIRQIDGTSAFAFLGQRGVDALSLLQHGFGKLLLLTIDSSLAIDELEGNTPSAGSGDIFYEWQRLRRSVLEGRPPVDKHELRLSPAFRERIAPWLTSSTIDDVLRWTPPAELPPAAERQPESDGKEFLWFVERFTKTYLSDWADESLALEYRYVLENWRPMHLPSELLLERDIKAEKVCHEISTRAVHGRSTDPVAQLVLVERALEAIREQRRDVAAAIFTAARTIEPNDASLANNHGFCLIPDEPAKAISVLAEARSLGSDNLLNFANTAAAYLVLGDPKGALQVCDEARAFGLTKTHVAWLWCLPIEGEPAVSEVRPATYICDLAIAAATSLGDEPLAESWRTRRGYISPAADSQDEA